MSEIQSFEIDDIEIVEENSTVNWSALSRLEIGLNNIEIDSSQSISISKKKTYDTKGKIYNRSDYIFNNNPDAFTEDHTTNLEDLDHRNDETNIILGSTSVYVPTMLGSDYKKDKLSMDRKISITYLDFTSSNVYIDDFYSKNSPLPPISFKVHGYNLSGNLVNESFDLESFRYNYKNKPRIVSNLDHRHMLNGSSLTEYSSISIPPVVELGFNIETIKSRSSKKIKDLSELIPKREDIVDSTIFELSKTTSWVEDNQYTSIIMDAYFTVVGEVLPKTQIETNIKPVSAVIEDFKPPSFSGQGGTAGSLDSLRYVIQQRNFAGIRLRFGNDKVESVLGLPQGLFFENEYIKGSPSLSGIYPISILLASGAILQGIIEVPVVRREF